MHFRVLKSSEPIGRPDEPQDHLSSGFKATRVEGETVGQHESRSSAFLRCSYPTCDAGRHVHSCFARRDGTPKPSENAQVYYGAACTETESFRKKIGDYEAGAY